MEGFKPFPWASNGDRESFAAHLCDHSHPRSERTEEKHLSMRVDQGGSVSTLPSLQRSEAGQRAGLEGGCVGREGEEEPAWGQGDRRRLQTWLSSPGIQVYPRRNRSYLIRMKSEPGVWLTSVTPDWEAMGQSQ